MILKAEAGIDIDATRKIWITLSGKTEEGEDPAAVIPVLAESIVEATVSAHDQAITQLGMAPATQSTQTFED